MFKIEISGAHSWKLRLTSFDVKHECAFLANPSDDSYALSLRTMVLQVLVPQLSKEKATSQVWVPALFPPITLVSAHRYIGQEAQDCYRTL